MAVISQLELCLFYYIGVPISSNDEDDSDIIPIIGGAVGVVILLLMITVVLLCIVILCMRRSYRKKGFSADDKVNYDLANLNTDVKLDHNPSYVVTTPDTVAYSTVKLCDSSVSITVTSNPSYYIPLTSNPSYNVPTKPYSEDDNYVQPNEYNQHSESIEMDTNPSYEVGKDRTTVFSTTKAGHSSHDATSEEYDYAYAQDDHLLHHNTTANTTDDTKITRSPYLTLVSNDAKAHNGSAAK